MSLLGNPPQGILFVVLCCFFSPFFLSGTGLNTACTTNGPACSIWSLLLFMSTPHVILLSMYPSVVISLNGTGMANSNAGVNGVLLSSMWFLLFLMHFL